MKQQVSHRLDVELLAWAGEYATERGSTRSTVIEEGLRHLRELSKGGVPDLPLEAPRQEVPKWQGVTDEGRAEYARNISVRQHALNAAKERASK